MNILILETGGTIACKKTDDTICLFDECEIIKEYKEKRQDIHFVIESPYRILSEQLSYCEINKLTFELWKNYDGIYDGIIVLCGSDTLQYISAASAYSVSNELCPIVFVAANYPIDDERSNAYANMDAALKLIENEKNGVYVSWKNNDEETTIHNALMLLTHAENSERFESIMDNYYAKYVDGEIVKNKEYMALNIGMPIGPLKLGSDSGILVIDCHPGDSFNYSLDGVDTVMIKPYHSGTLPTDNHAFKAFCAGAKRMSVPIFATATRDSDKYESTKVYDQLGITTFDMIPFASAYVRMWIANSQKQRNEGIV